MFTPEQIQFIQGALDLTVRNSGLQYAAMALECHQILAKMLEDQKNAKPEVEPAKKK